MWFHPFKLSLRPDRSIPSGLCCCDPVDVFIHPAIHPSTLSSTWSSVGLLACCETKTWAGRGQNEHPGAWVHRRWQHRNRYWWSTPAAHLSSTLLSLFIVHIFFFKGFSVCLGISFATFSRAFFDLLSFSAVSLSPFLNFQGVVSIMIAIKSSESCTCLWIFSSFFRNSFLLLRLTARTDDCFRLLLSFRCLASTSFIFRSLFQLSPEILWFARGSDFGSFSQFNSVQSIVQSRLFQLSILFLLGTLSLYVRVFGTQFWNACLMHILPSTISFHTCSLSVGVKIVPYRLFVLLFENF